MDEYSVKPYEVAFLAKHENGAASLIKHLTENGGEILSEGELKEIELSYPIKKNASAYFGCIHCNLSPEKIGDIRGTLNLDNDVLRFLIVSPPFEKAAVERAPRRRVFEEEREGRSKAPARPQPETSLSNDLLEEKLEEILK